MPRGRNDCFGLGQNESGTHPEPVLKVDREVAMTILA